MLTHPELIGRACLNRNLWFDLSRACYMSDYAIHFEYTLGKVSKKKKKKGMDLSNAHLTPASQA